MGRFVSSLLVFGCLALTGVASAQVVPLTNEDCSTAIPVFTGINPSAPAGLSGNVFTNLGGAEPLPVGSPPLCGSAPNSDVWFIYNASATGNHTFGTCTPAGFTAGTHNDTVLQVLDGTVCPPVQALGCDDDSCGSPNFASNLTVALTAGTSYYVRVATWNAATPDGSFYLSIAAPVPAPANDECGGAIALVEGVNGPFDNAFATNSVNFTTPAPCQAGTGHPGSNDVFFTYTAICDGTVDIATCDPIGFIGTNDDTQLMAYPASDCPGPPGAPLGCNDDFGCGSSGFQSSITFPVTGGSSYLVRVSSWATGGGTFDVTVTRHTAMNSQIGPGCSDGGGAGPVLDIDLPPVLCATRTLSITGAAPAAGGMLMFSVPATPTGLSGGCPLYLNQGGLFLLFFIGTDVLGNWQATLGIPCDPLLECATFTVQGILFPTTPPPFYQVTSGLSVTLGY